MYYAVQEGESDGMRVEFRDEHGELRYYADMDAIPRDGDRVTFPSGRSYRVSGPANWVIDKRESEHIAVLRVIAPPKRPATAKSATKKAVSA